MPRNRKATRGGEQTQPEYDESKDQPQPEPESDPAPSSHPSEDTQPYQPPAPKPAPPSYDNPPPSPLPTPAPVSTPSPDPVDDLWNLFDPSDLIDRLSHPNEFIGPGYLNQEWTRQGVDNVIRMLNELFTLPADLPQVSFHWPSALGDFDPNYGGVFSTGTGLNQVGMNPSSGMHPVEVALHELGHWWDTAGPVEDKMWENPRFSNNPDLRRAIEGTRTSQFAKEALNPLAMAEPDQPAPRDFLQYSTLPNEEFARAFTTYVLQKLSGSKDFMTRTEPGVDVTNFQWGMDEFDPIFRVLDELLAPYLRPGVGYSRDGMGVG